MLTPRYDCHLHSYFSPCAKLEMTPENIVKRARELHLDGLCITDHLHHDTPIEQYDKLREQIQRIDTSSLEIWIGCEVNIYSPNSWSIRNEWIEKFDVILASPIHWIDKVEKPVNMEFDTIVEYMCGMISGAINCPGVNIISHPFWFPRPEEVDIDMPAVLKKIIDEKKLVPIFKQAEKQNTAFEINPKTIEEDIYEQAKRFYTQAVEYGVKLSTCSDAHSLEMMDVWAFHEKFADELGVSVDNLWIPIEQLKPIG